MPQTKQKKIHEHYEIIDNQTLKRKRPFCERCGTGVFMADHDDFWVCGKCGLRQNKKFFRLSVK